MYRRRRLVAGGVFVVAILLVLLVSGAFSGSPQPAKPAPSQEKPAHLLGARAGRNGRHPRSRPAAHGRRAGRSSGGARPGASAKRAALAAAESGLLPWQLPNPISRESVVASQTPGVLLLAGGLTASGSSSNGVFSLTTTNGSLHPVTNLPQATHDVAGATLGGSTYFFGGGVSGPSTTVQAITASSSRVAGQLPQARADAQAITLGNRIYLVGGYSGATMDPDVLATANGQTFSTIAALPVPVRYPALASIGSTIYVFGGETRQGTPVQAVQAVNVATGKARVVGRLPQALGGATAATISGAVYVAGGVMSNAQPSNAIYAFNPATDALARAGSLHTAVAYAGAAVTGGRLWIVGGQVTGGSSSNAVQMLVPNVRFGHAGQPGAGSPYFGERLLVADRGNNRLLLLSDTGAILWEYPSAKMPPPPGGFYFPDDAFFIHHGQAIISNQEENETLVEIAFPSGKIIWQYGHPHQPGYAPGYLNNPDDAYLLKDGDISVADPKNCRVLIIDPTTKAVLHQIGTPGACVHQPPNDLGSPNGDTPLPDGNLLVSEINGGWIDEYTTTGHLVWDVQLPSVSYPSDPQPLPGTDRYLVADYTEPGAFVEFNRAGQILYRYGPSSGLGELNQPSLVEQLPSGVLMANDDYNDRMVAIDPQTGALVWQYGVEGHPGTAPGYLNTPDGFDILGPGGTTPTHTATG